MFKNIVRGVLGLQGALAVLVAVSIFLDPVKVAAQLGVSPIGSLGVATIRADLGSLFAGAGLFMLAAALRGDRWFLLPPIVFTSLALAARAASMSLSGFEPALVEPMVVEAVTLTILLIGSTLLARN